MAHGDGKDQLASLTAALQTFEKRLTAPDVPLELVSDFKCSVDDIRLRLWGLLTARNSDDHEAFQQRFRLRRLREMCLQIGADLRAGGMAADPEELRRLATAAGSLVTAATYALDGTQPPPS